MIWDKSSRNKLYKNKWLYLEKLISSVLILLMVATMFVFLPPTGVEKAEAAAGNTAQWTLDSHFTSNGPAGANYTGATTYTPSEISISGDSITLGYPDIDFNKQTIAGGEFHTHGLKGDGTVVSVGDNAYSQLNTGSWSNIKAITAGGQHTVGLKDNGTVVAVGRNIYGQLNVSGWTNIKAISGGYMFTVGLKNDGTVVAVGDNFEGQLNMGSWTNIKAISAGTYHTVGLKNDGTVVAVGDNTYSQLNTSSWSNIKAIAASRRHTVGLKDNGTVVAVGSNSSGQRNTGGWTNIKAVAVGGSHTIGLKGDGTVVATGSNGSNQLDTGSWSNIKAIAAGWDHTIGLKGDGTVIAVGLNDDSQTNVSGWTSIRQPTYAYPTPGTISDFKIDAGTGLIANWSDISWNSMALPANTSIKFEARSADSEANLSGASWVGPFTQSTLNSTIGSNTLSGVQADQWLEVRLTLETSDGFNTPTLNDFTVTYDTIDAPTNLTQYRYDSNENGSTAIADNGWGNESTAILKTDMTGIENGTTLTPEIELRDDTSFTGTAGVSDVAGASVAYTGALYGGSAVSGKAKITSLTPGTYYWKVRTKDDASPVNRVGSWSATYNTLKIEQTAPTGSVLIDSGNDYTTQNGVTLDLSSAADADSGLDKMMASEDPNFLNALLGDIIWQDYLASYPFTLSVGDATKTVYVKFKDNAGNTSSDYTFNESFSTTTYKETVANEADWNTTDTEVKLPLVNAWNAQTSGTTEGLEEIHFINSSTGWAVGYNGTILKTTDGGDTWVTKNSGVTSTLRDVFFIDASNGWTVSQIDGRILKTEDGGESWATKASLGVTLIGVHFIDANTGWVVGAGGTIRKTTNGGDSWSSQNNGTENHFDVHFIDANTGWIAGNAGGNIKKTTNGGTSWTTQTPASPPDFYQIQFLDANTGYAGGAYGGGENLYKTTDGGSNWNVLPAISSSVYNLHFVDANNGWVITAGGIYKTTDGGSNWVQETSTVFKGSYFVDANTGWVAGWNGVIEKLSTTYQPSENKAQSLEVSDANATNITKTTLTATESNDTGTDVSYWMSADGGGTWDAVSSGVEKTFTVPGNDLRWKATLDSGTASNTAKIQNIAISYTHQESDSIVLDTAGPATVVEEDGKTSIGFTDATKVVEIASDSWTQDTTPYFSWKASVDADLDGAAPYKVYFGTNSSATAAVDGAAQTDTFYDPATTYQPAIDNAGILTDGTYYLKIVAKDLAGNYSATSKDYILKIDTIAPDTSAIIPATTSGISDKITVSWGLPVEGGSGVNRFNVFWEPRNVEANEAVPTVTDASSVYTANISDSSDITANTFDHLAPPALGTRTYYYKIKAIDNAGNVSSLSLQGGPGNIQDSTAPSAPTSGPTAVSQVNGTVMDVSWGAASDNVGVTEYRVTYSLDDATYISAGAPVTSGTSFSHTGLIDNTQYYYKVRAYDAQGLAGTLSNAASAVTTDVTDPSAPAWNTIDGSEGYSNSQVNLDWAAPQDLNNDSATSGTGISGYDVYRASDTYDGNTYPTLSSLSAITPTFDTGPLNGGTRETGTTYSNSGLATSYTWYAYKVKAYDDASSHALISTDNASVDSATIWIRTKKDTQPVGVSNVALTTPTGDPSVVDGVGDKVTVSFTGGASKNDELDSYEIYRATSNYATTAEWLTSAVKVKTFVKADLAPVSPGLIGPVAYNDNDTPTPYAFIDTGLTDNTIYYYKVRVVDFIAEENDTFYAWTPSAASQETEDTTSPTVPGYIEVTDLAPKGTTSNIESHPIMMVYWEHVGDLVGHGTAGDETFVEYRLYRSTNVNFTSPILVHNGLENYYRDEIVVAEANQQYWYKVTTADGTDHGGGLNNESEGLVYGPINPSSLDKVAPSILTRSETINASSATINLGLDETSEAKILFGSGSTCSNLGRSVGTAVNTNSPSVEMRKLSPNSTYSYRVVVTDNNGNKRTSTCYSFNTPSFVLNSIEQSVSVSAATLKWRANASADSFIKYTNSKTGETRIVANDIETGANAQHSLGLKGLAAGTKYTYTLISKDEYANRATKTGSFTTAKFKATSVSVSTTVSSAIVTWKTNVSSDSFVRFGTKNVNSNVTGNDTSVKTHRIILRKLSPGTKYKFRVKSRDAHDNIAIKANSGSSFTTKPFRISSVKTRTSTNSATVTWTTNARSTSSVEYRSATDKVSQLSGDARLTTRHSVVIKNLEDDTAYSYRIKSRDKEDNIAESKMLSFKTNSLEREYDVNPKVSDLDEMELSATSAKIAWTTAGSTSSWVDYGTSRSLSKSAGNDTMTVDHIVELTNLTPGMLYYYRVRGQDAAGNKYQSSVLTFTALVEPKITEEAKVKPSNDSAVITWKTNTDTDSIVEYGLTDKYGDSSGSGALAKEHEVKVEGLAQNTTYHFRIGGVDKYSVKVMSEDSTFKTSKDTIGPKIDDIRSETLRSRDAEGKEKISVIVNFTTNEEATSYVEYAEGITMATYNKKTRLNNTLNLSHSALIEGLKPATTYHYRIVTKDRYGNTTKSMDKTILTPKESETVLQKIIKILEETFGWVSNLRDYLSKKVNSFRK